MLSNVLNRDDYNLLIIDDEVDITKALVRQFRKKYNVFSTTDAADGLRIMERENIQVVLSDQRMPGMTGVDFFKRIKDKYPDALKLILTGYADIEAVIGAINEGQVFRYVKKPWNPDELETTIREAFEKYELITHNRRLMHSLQEMNATLEEKVKTRTLELERLNERLSELNMEKNRYIGMVAHDLRNPIGVAASYSDLLIEDFDSILRKDHLDYLGEINASCYFSLDLIRDFLDASKIEAGIFDLNCNEQDYVTFVKQNIRQNDLFARGKAQTIVLESAIDRLMAYFDASKMQQVLNNLISNAIKYSQQHTQIVVRISANEDSVLTSISDQGQGIPESELPNVFQPYQTTSVKPTGNEKATGLGLAIVKKIIDAHRGEISVVSTPGKGSIFSFSLPVNPLKN